MTREEAIQALKKEKRTALHENKVAFNMAIKALSQEPCEDAISRQAVLDIVRFENKWLFDARRYNNDTDIAFSGIISKVSDLPSVTPTQKWIPCSERLPKENEYIGDVCKYYLIQDEYGDMHVAHFSNVGWIPMDSLKAIGNEIVAWQELPQPYTESEEV